jgi:hypothetical protein
MIQMAMGDENPGQSFKTDPSLKDLSLGAFAAINQEAIFIVFYDLRGQVAAH